MLVWQHGRKVAVPMSITCHSVPSPYFMDCSAFHSLVMSQTGRNSLWLAGATGLISFDPIRSEKTQKHEWDSSVTWTRVNGSVV